MTNEPIVGIPEEMALAISKALDLCDTWRLERRPGRASIKTTLDIYDLLSEADAIIEQIEEALEDYTEA